MNHFDSRRSLFFQNHFRRMALFFSLLAVLVVSATLLNRWSTPSIVSDRPIERNPDGEQSVLVDSGATFQPSSERRPIYPYSVIPGGVRDPEELRAASARDEVVRDHYVRFDFRKARVVSVHKSRLVYLSYRIGDKIYWTKKRVSLHKGEQLITDGKITVRTRCGNRVASLPQKYGFSREPSAAMFDKPVAGSSTEIPFPENFGSALESRPNLPGWGQAPLAPELGTTIASGSAPFGSGYPSVGSPLAPEYPCGKIGGASCSSGSAPGRAPSRPSTPVPEPGTGELLCAEILAAILAWRVLSKEPA